MGEVTVAAIKAEFEQRVAAGEFIGVEQPPGRARPRVHHAGDDRARARHDPGDARRPAARSRRSSSVDTRSAIEHDLSASERRTSARPSSRSSRAATRSWRWKASPAPGRRRRSPPSATAAEREGYRVEGFAPTSRAAQKLARPASRRSTLQRHLTRHEEPHDGQQAPLRARRVEPGEHEADARVPASAQTQTTACCSSAMCASIRPSRPGDPISSSRRRASRRPGWTTSCGSRIRPSKQVVEQLSRGEVQRRDPAPRRARAACTKSRTATNGSRPSRASTPGTRTARWSCRRTINHARRSTR